MPKADKFFRDKDALPLVLPAIDAALSNRGAASVSPNDNMFEHQGNNSTSFMVSHPRRTTLHRHAPFIMFLSVKGCG